MFLFASKEHRCTIKEYWFATNEHCYKWTLPQIKWFSADGVMLQYNLHMQYQNRLSTCSTIVIELEQENDMLITTNIDVLQMNT